jgi:plasmid stabilization system protein ParE
MRLRWTARARRDLQEIGRYIAEDDPGAARQWVARLQERARVATRSPMSGRRVPELQRDDVREVFLRSYRIVYRIRGAVVDVLCVFEGHRLLPGEVDPS